MEKRRNNRLRFTPGICLIAITACVHHNRVSPLDIQRLTRNREEFVLVFGSVSAPKGTLKNPAIHFLHQATASAPEYVLQSLTITSGERFYAVLRRPEALAHLDEFIAEVGSPDTGFDRITYVRLQEDAGPLAMYVGEIRMSPADNRTAQGQKVVVTTHDDFQNATQELKRLYPNFKGTIAKVALLRNLSPPSYSGRENSLMGESWFQLPHNDGSWTTYDVLKANGLVRITLIQEFTFQKWLHVENYTSGFRWSLASTLAGLILNEVRSGPSLPPSSRKKYLSSLC